MFTWLAMDTVFAIGFGSGGALVWFYKAKIQSLVIGVNAVSAKLHAEAAALEAKAAAVKTVVTK